MNNNDIDEAKRIILHKIQVLNGEFGSISESVLAKEESLIHVTNKLQLFNEAFDELINEGFVKCTKHDKKLGVISPTLTRSGRDLFS